MEVKKLSIGMLLAGFLLAGSMVAHAQKTTFHGEQVSLKQAFEKQERLSRYEIVINNKSNKLETANQSWLKKR